MPALRLLLLLLYPRSSVALSRPPAVAAWRPAPGKQRPAALAYQRAVPAVADDKSCRLLKLMPVLSKPLTDVSRPALRHSKRGLLFPADDTTWPSWVPQPLPTPRWGAAGTLCPKRSQHQHSKQGGTILPAETQGVLDVTCQEQPYHQIRQVADGHVCQPRPPYRGGDMPRVHVCCQ